MKTEKALNKQISILIAFNGVSSFADSFFYLVLLSFVTQETALRNIIPLVSMSETLPYFLSVFIGTLADKTQHKRHSLFLSSVIRILVYTGITFLSMGSNLQVFVIAACLLNVISDIFGKYGGSLQIPAIKLLLPDEEKMEQIQGLNSAVGQIATIAGTLAGGFLFTRLSVTILLSINVALFGLVLLLTIGLLYQFKRIYHEIEAQRQEADFKFLPELKETIKLVFQTKGLRIKLLLVSMTNCLLSLTLTIVSMRASGQKIAGQLSLIQTLQIIFMIAGSILVGSVFKKTRLSSLFTLFFGSYLLFLILLFFQHASLATLLVAVFALALGMITPKLMTLIISSVNVKNIGGFVGAINTLIMLAPFINTLILQLLTPVMTVTHIIGLYIIVAVICLVVSLITGTNEEKQDLISHEV